jgi:hypothetical protein
MRLLPLAVAVALFWALDKKGAAQSDLARARTADIPAAEGPGTFDLWPWSGSSPGRSTRCALATC